MGKKQKNKTFFFTYARKALKFLTESQGNAYTAGDIGNGSDAQAGDRQKKDRMDPFSRGKELAGD